MENAVYEVIWSKNAEKEFSKLPKNIQEQLQPVIDGLDRWYELPNLSAIQNRRNAFRIRKGNYRIGFLVNNRTRELSIAKAGKKDKFYD